MGRGLPKRLAVSSHEATRGQSNYLQMTMSEIVEASYRQRYCNVLDNELKQKLANHHPAHRPCE